MTSVTQTIPTLTGGLSQQPDELKIPGQVNVATNVIPDVTHGLLKRPGSKLLKSLSDTSTNLNSEENGKWFSYYRDETESYIGQVSRTGDINMWHCATGNPVTVTNTFPTTTTIASSFTRDANGVITIEPLTDSNTGLIPNHNLNVGEVVNITLPSGSTSIVTGEYSVIEVVSNTSFKIKDETTNAAITVAQGVFFQILPYRYLKHTADEDIQTLTLNDFTFLTNRTRPVGMSTTVSPVRPPEVFIDLRATAYARQYAVNIFDSSDPADLKTVTTATRISVELVKSSNNYCSAVDMDSGSDTRTGFMYEHVDRINDSLTHIRCSKHAGDGRDAYAPNVGTRIFNITDGDQLTDEAAVGGIKSGGFGSTAAVEVDNDFSYPINVIAGGANGTGTTDVSTLTRVPTNLYFRIRTTGQSVPFTTGTGNNQETTYQARYTTTHDLLYGGEGWELGDYFYVWMKDGYYKVTVESISTTQVQANLGLIRPNPTPFDTETTVTAESILGDIRQAIIDAGNFTSANIQQIGNGLYITRTTGAFNISAPSTDLLKVMSNEVTNVDDLPDQCKHGYVVKVANSAADEDDYYLKFIGELKDGGNPDNDADYLDGAGVWEECAKPGDNIEFNKGTMPIQLVRQADGTFTVSQVSYDNAEVGTTVVGGTNPRPSFVDHKINQLVFFRNRLVFLSDENVIMSRPGDFFNFWSKTATTHTPQDVIDLSCSSEYPAIVYDGIQINAGLLLFTKNQQFMLTTDSDILSPETAKLNAVSTYNFNEKTRPVSLGTTVAFLDNANKFTRFFEMSNVVRQGEPDIVDQSAVISKLLNKDINLIAESRENSVVFFAQKGTKTIYGFRYFTSGDRRLLQAWFTWEVVGDIQYLCMLDDALYAITRGTGNKDQMVKYSLKLDDAGFFVTDTQETDDTDDDVIYKVHLDHMSSVTAAANTYNSTTKKTTIPKPNGYVYDTTQLVAYDIDPGNDLGRYSLVTVNGSNLEIDGDWSNNTFILGYLYEMDVQIPTLYVTKPEGTKYRSDAKSSLIIHRVKFSFGPLGVYSTTINRVGKPDYTEEFELGLAGFIEANRLPIVEEKIETVPCYERNTNLKINVKSSHPSPATLYSLAWEGDFTNRFYRRV